MKYLNLTLLFSSIVFAAYSSFTEHSYIIPSLLFIGSLGMFLYEKTLKSFEYKQFSQEFSRLKEFTHESANEFSRNIHLLETGRNSIYSKFEELDKNLAELDQKIERTKQSADLAAKTLINRPQRNTI